MSEQVLERERLQLTGVAYRLLGTTAEAEDAVQEAYVRWYRMSESERSSVAKPGAWLTRVVGRICLDMLTSARARRELYVGPWLPEPVPGSLFATARTADDPADEVAREESVGTALLLVLEAMTPAERVAFVLHDVFGVSFDEVAAAVGRSPAAARQLASSARQRVSSNRRRPVSRHDHDAVVRDFLRACQTGDLAALTHLLDPDVRLSSDGGGVVTAARRPILGPDRVARFLLGVAKKTPVTLRLAESADGLCLVADHDDTVTSVINIGVQDTRISEVWAVLNPEKLRRWSRPTTVDD